MIFMRKGGNRKAVYQILSEPPIDISNILIFKSHCFHYYRPQVGLCCLPIRGCPLVCQQILLYNTIAILFRKH